LNHRRLVPLVALVAGVALSCSGTSAQQAKPKAKPHRSTTTSTSTSTSTSTTTTTPPPVQVGLRVGASGPEVTALQQRLAALKYDVPSTDGRFGAATQQAVLAFQKVEGLSRDGVAGPQTLGRLQAAGVPGPMVPNGGATRVEIDVARQVLFFYQGGSLFKTVAVSTGSGQRFCVDGRCAIAVTPSGSFRVGTKIPGWQTGKLGRLYKPSYFNGNIAIHGALSVPAGPASHGCVRVPMSSADWIYAALGRGTAVYVLNGPKAPAPFNDSAPPTKPDTNQAPGDVTPIPPTGPPVTAPPPSTASSTSTTSSTTTTSSTPPTPSST
jgi:peptidoglycan hydrolase-like protein with peptidoglycan-binding domain